MAELDIPEASQPDISESDTTLADRAPCQDVNEDNLIESRPTTSGGSNGVDDTLPEDAARILENAQVVPSADLDLEICRNTKSLTRPDVRPESPMFSFQAPHNPQSRNSTPSTLQVPPTHHTPSNQALAQPSSNNAMTQQQLPPAETAPVHASDFRAMAASPPTARTPSIGVAADHAYHQELRAVAAHTHHPVRPSSEQPRRRRKSKKSKSHLHAARAHLPADASMIGNIVDFATLEPRDILPLGQRGRTDIQLGVSISAPGMERNGQQASEPPVSTAPATRDKHLELPTSGHHIGNHAAAPTTMHAHIERNDNQLADVPLRADTLQASPTHERRHEDFQAEQFHGTAKHNADPAFDTACNHFTQTVQQWQQQLKTAHEEQLQNLNQELHDSKVAEQKLVEKLVGSQNGEERLKDKLKQCRQRLSDLEQVKKELQIILVAKEGDLQQARRLAENVSMGAESLRSAVDENNTQMTRLEEVIGRIDGEHSQLVHKSEIDIRSLQQRNEALEKELSTNAGLLAEERDRSGGFSAQLWERERFHNSLRELLEGYVTELRQMRSGAAEQSNAETNKELVNIWSCLEEVRRTIEQNEQTQSINSMHELIKSVQEKMTSVAELCKPKESEAPILTAAVNNVFHEQIDRLKQELDLQRFDTNTLSEKDNAIALQKERLEVKQNEVANLAAQSRQLKTQADAFQQASIALEARNAALQAQVDLNAGAQARSKDNLIEMASIRRDLAAATEKSSRAEGQIELLNTTKADLQKQVEDLQRKVNEQSTAPTPTAGFSKEKADLEQKAKNQLENVIKERAKQWRKLENQQYAQHCNEIRKITMEANRLSDNLGSTMQENAKLKQDIQNTVSLQANMSEEAQRNILQIEELKTQLGEAAARSDRLAEEVERQRALDNGLARTPDRAHDDEDQSNALDQAQGSIQNGSHAPTQVSTQRAAGSGDYIDNQNITVGDQDVVSVIIQAQQIALPEIRPARKKLDRRTNTVTEIASVTTNHADTQSQTGPIDVEDSTVQSDAMLLDDDSLDFSQFFREQEESVADPAQMSYDIQPFTAFENQPAKKTHVVADNPSSELSEPSSSFIRRIESQEESLSEQQTTTGTSGNELITARTPIPSGPTRTFAAPNSASKLMHSSHSDSQHRPPVTSRIESNNTLGRRPASSKRSSSQWFPKSSSLTQDLRSIDLGTPDDIEDEEAESQTPRVQSDKSERYPLMTPRDTNVGRSNTNSSPDFIAQSSTMGRKTSTTYSQRPTKQTSKRSRQDVEDEQPGSAKSRKTYGSASSASGRLLLPSSSGRSGGVTKSPGRKTHDTRQMIGSQSQAGSSSVISRMDSSGGSKSRKKTDDTRFNERFARELPPKSSTRRR